MKKITVLALAGITFMFSCNSSSSSEVKDAKENLSVAKDELKEAQANESEDWNHLSYVIAIVYGKTLVVLGGDASQEAWQNILDHHNGTLPKTTVLQASHHGRDSGYHCDSVASMNPNHVIVSVGKKPSTDASNKYRQHAENGVYSTRYHGTILAVCDDQGSSTLFDNDLEVIS